MSFDDFSGKTEKTSTPGARGKPSTWFPRGGHVENFIAPRDKMGRSVINFEPQKFSTSASRGNQVDGFARAPSVGQNG